MRTGELKRILSNGGCYIIRHGANHDIWYSPSTGNQFPVARHDSKEIATGTANGILKDAGLKRK